MHKKLFLILALCIVSLVVTSLLIWNFLSPQIPQKYERNIVRYLDNQEEERALNVAESINYTAIASLERFDGSKDPEAYLHPGTYLAYTYANFIDSEVMNYYETRYDNLQGKGYPRQIELTYDAKVSKQPEFRIFNSPAPEGVTWHNTTIVFSATDGSVWRKDSGNMKFFHRNQSSYQTIEWGFDFNFSDCYFVEMKLEYSEVYAPTAAFFSEVYQVLILDRSFEPVLLGVESFKALA